MTALACVRYHGTRSLGTLPCPHLLDRRTKEEQYAKLFAGPIGHLSLARRKRDETFQREQVPKPLGPLHAASASTLSVQFGLIIRGVITPEARRRPLAGGNRPNCGHASLAPDRRGIIHQTRCTVR